MTAGSTPTLAPINQPGDEHLLPISALQHLAFCPRQWGLIHLEQVWVENRLTEEGKVLHRRVDLPGQSRRPETRSVRGMWLRSQQLGLYGRADLVEFSPNAFTVEYKRGKRKPNDCDIVQLCAQAMCLEEMLEMAVPEGAFFYGEPRRRLAVRFTPEVRLRTMLLAAEMHRLFNASVTPASKPGPQCRSCSLVHLCLPLNTGEIDQTEGWLNRLTNSLDDQSVENNDPL